LELIDRLRAQLDNDAGTDAKVAVTWRQGVLVVRYLGSDSEQARNCFTALWQLIRPVLSGREASIPRIWLT
ncbi:MAG: urease accessory protein UreD, partial [Motiliproteus sp.]